MPKNVKKRFFLDYSILIPFLILGIIGIIMVYSASSYMLLMTKSNPATAALKQAAFFVVGLIAILFIYKMKTSVYQNRRFMMTMIAVIAGILVLTLFFGEERNGSRAWIDLPGIGQIQPGEFLKILIIWYLAFIFSRRQKTLANNFWQATLKPLSLVGALILLVLLQKDTGGAVILVLITIVMILASGINYMWSFVALGGGIIGSYGIIQFILLMGDKIFPGNLKYIYDRFAVFKDPFIEEMGTGHQMVNGYYAMFNGGWFGVGLGNSVQKKGFLPEAQNDFIFAIVLEELGVIASVLILGLLLFLILRILMVGIRSTNPFNSLMCYGVGSMLTIQTFINLGGITGLIPLTGVTFPFISQGGSSLLVLSLAIGFILNISADEKRQKFQESLEYERSL